MPGIEPLVVGCIPHNLVAILTEGSQQPVSAECPAVMRLCMGGRGTLLSFLTLALDEVGWSASTPRPSHHQRNASLPINPLKTKRRLLYLKTQFVPRSKHFSSRS